MALGGPAQVSQKAALGQQPGLQPRQDGLGFPGHFKVAHSLAGELVLLLMGDLVPLHRGLSTGTGASTCRTGDVSQSRSLRTRALASLLLMTEPWRHGAPVPPDPVGQASREDAPGEGGDPREGRGPEESQPGDCRGRGRGWEPRQLLSSKHLGPSRG